MSIISLRPHSTHKLQPPTNTFMGTFKAYYSEEIKNWIRTNQRPLTFFDLIEQLRKALFKTKTTEVLIKSFRVNSVREFTPLREVYFAMPTRGSWVWEQLQYNIRILFKRTSACGCGMLPRILNKTRFPCCCGGWTSFRVF